MTMRLLQIIIAILVFHSQFATGQQLLNNGFEDILTVASPHPFPVPEYWEMVFPELYFTKATLSEESYSGDWAIKLETKSQMGLNPCRLSTMFHSSDLLSGISAHPLNNSPGQLSLYYKYLPVGGDTASISVVLFNFPDTVPFFGPYLAYTDTLFYLEQDIVHAVETYTQLLLDLDYQSDSPPEYIAVDIVTNKNASEYGDLEPGQGNAGTTLWVDDIELMYPVSTANNLVSESDITLSPLPAADYFQIQKPGHLNIQRAVLYDLTGKERMVFDPTQSRYQIGELTRGMYLLHLTFQNGQAVKKLLKQ